MAFLDGLFVDHPHEKAPDFVKVKMSFNIQKLGKELKDRWNKGDKYVNLQIKESKNGKLYAEIDEWVPDKKR